MLQLPKNWKWAKLGDVADYLNGRGFKKSEWEDNGMPIIRIQNLNKEKSHYNYTTKLFEDRYRVKKGDLLFAWAASLGTYLWKGKDAWLNQHIFKVVPKEFCDKTFLYYSLEKVIAELYYKTHGSGMVHVTKGKFESTLIPFPPKPIQQAIVTKIEELFSELNKGIETLRLAQQQLKTYRQSVLKWAFEGRLTNENVDEGELPKDWKNTNIDEVATVGTGATPLKSRSEYYGGNIAWVTSGALNEEYVREATDFVTEKAIKETNLSLYPKHTLLVAMYGEGKTRGKCSELLIEACTNQAIAAIFFDKHQIAVKPYLKYFLLKNYTDIRKKSSGGVQPNLNLGIIKKLKFPLAPIEEQSKIVQEIETRLSVADKMEESIAQSLQRAEALRQSILKKAFEGNWCNKEQ